ncbi:MAG TPA: DUF1573 domain-containing protein [Caulifigura sp.]|nr:DUF1573 domain-containing protein [Caulifigura sp.]
MVASPRFALLLAACLLAGCGSKSPGLSAPSAARRLFDRTEQDLGALRLNSAYTANYRLVNSTDQPIVIRNISTSCGCLVAERGPFTVAPGAERVIPLELSTKDATVLGPLVKHASVTLDAGERVELTLLASLEPDFEISPRSLTLTAGEPQRLHLDRKQMDLPTFDRLSLVSAEDFYDLKEIPEGRREGHREFEVTLKDTPAGSTLPTIEVADSSTGKTLPFSTVRCTRHGPTLRPSACVFAVSGQKPLVPQKFELQAPSPGAQILSVETAGDGIEQYLGIQFDRNQDAKSFMVEMKSTPEATFTRLEIEVFYESDGGESGKLVLPCHILNAPRS